MPAVEPQQICAAAMLLIFAYGGYEVTGVLAGEASNPRRDVPFAFVADADHRVDRDVAGLARRDRRAAGSRGHAHAAGRRRGDLSSAPAAR